MVRTGQWGAEGSHTDPGHIRPQLRFVPDKSGQGSPSLLAETHLTLQRQLSICLFRKKEDRTLVQQIFAEQVPVTGRCWLRGGETSVPEMHASLWGKVGF